MIIIELIRCRIAESINTIMKTRIKLYNVLQPHNRRVNSDNFRLVFNCQNLFACYAVKQLRNGVL